jgi:preprotein translocase subunit SecA
MLKFIAKIFGTKSEKDIKRIMPLVEKTKAEGERLISISNDELRNETQKSNTINRLRALTTSWLACTKSSRQSRPRHCERSRICGNRSDRRQRNRNSKGPSESSAKAFAIVKETARKFKENEFLK